MAGARTEAAFDAKFQCFRDPNFVEMVENVVVLYLNPPSKALVLSVNEKARSQALDRTHDLPPDFRTVE
jgi:hypothetical protein